MVKCNSCGGQYEPIQADGTQYFHVCPPLSVAELKALDGAGKLTVTGSTKAALDAAAAADTVTPPKPGDASQRDQVLAGVTMARPNARNENVPGTKAGDKGQVTAPGKGVTTVAAAPADVTVKP